jgi:SAM-dependent methyltransferase
MSSAPARAVVALWQTAQWFAAPRGGAMIRRALRAHVGTTAGRWLDVGCGPRSLAGGALAGTIVGLDRKAFGKRWSTRGETVFVCGDAIALPFGSHCFDGVFCLGLLHHLDDSDANLTLAEMRRVARPGAVLLIFDAVRPDSALRRPLAAMLRACDRGRHVRTESAFRRLLTAQGFAVGARKTYAWTGLEGCIAVAQGLGYDGASTGGEH